MGVTDADFQQLIITSLANADPTALAGLQHNVPLYWNLHARQGVLPELRFWYTKREAIRYLMACINQQTDYMRRTNTATRAMTASSRQDSQMDASATETATSLANRTSSSYYNSATNSSGSGSSVMNRSANQVMNANGSMSDTGQGANTGNQTSLMSSSSTVSAVSSDASAMARNTVHEVCGTYEHVNQSVKVSAGVNPGIGGALTYTDTYEYIPPANDTITTSDLGNSVSQSVSKQNDLRNNTMTQSASQSSSSYFNANRVSSDVMTASGSSVMTSSASSTFSLVGSGAGAMTGAGAGSSTMIGSSTRVENGTGEAHRISNALSTMVSSLEKLHQRFLHLQEMWAKANEMIDWFEKQRLNIPVNVFQMITLQYPDGLNADAANAYVIKTPRGWLTMPLP
jgi:hypothetical protein